MNANTYSKETNKDAWLAWQLISETSVNLFLTGKAGTGKTTFLKTLHTSSPKRMAIVAPTGVAAINAGGVTIHSFFQLPFSPYIPDTKFKADYTMRKEKINIIRTLDMLVIDEISMVRADLLDAVDASLRHYRRNDMPFGGVQIVMIGDLQQLPPVVVESERALIESYYPTPYFFSSKVLQKSSYVTVELNKVYRQSDVTFVNLLNKIRENKADDETLRLLNSRFVDNFDPKDSDGYIRLTTHNSQADNINSMKLLKLDTEERCYECRIEGNFPESSFPADRSLKLKKGAQVMFIKNDKSPDKRYYNGKIGVVTSLGKDTVGVRCISDGVEVVLEYDKWDNTKYVIDKETNEISEEVEGEFSQIPLRLAWAVTIHKSQGLTFDKAIIDAQMSFAHGQVYVALSRCRTLEGIVLSSKISRSSVISDGAISLFVNNQAQRVPSESAVEQMKAEYALQLVRQLFDFRLLTSAVYRLQRLFEENLYKTYPKLISEVKAILSISDQEITLVANKFVDVCSAARQCGVDIRNDDGLKNRVVKGAKYFYTKVESLLKPLYDKFDVDIDNKVVKKQLDDIRDTYNKDINVKLAELKSVSDNGFDVDLYLKARANAIIEAERSKSPKKSVSSVFGNNKPLAEDIKHPQLYKRIVAWRREKAEELNVAAFQILTQKAVFDLVDKLPENESQLKKVNGIGNTKVKQFGKDLLSMVKSYINAKDI